MTDARVAIVTGGSRGIGAAISRRLARDGSTVVVNTPGDEGAAHDTVGGIEGRWLVGRTGRRVRGFNHHLQRLRQWPQLLARA